MKLATFVGPHQGPARIGLVSDDNTQLLDLAGVAARARIELPFDPFDMLSLIKVGAPALATISTLGAQAEPDLSLEHCRLLAPIPRPRKNVFCVGWNYLEHFAEGSSDRPNVQEMPQHPTFFSKAPTSVTGPYDEIPFHGQVSTQLDWEAELGVIIGRTGSDYSEVDAPSAIFGYCVINDLSWRDIQRRHGQQWFKGKSLDGSCAMGPWITTADAVDPSNLAITCRVDGVVKQSGSTQQMYFKLPRVIAELSAGLTLEAGDVISSGTPPGVGYARKPPEFLAPGNVVETEVEGLGCQRNRVGAPRKP